jgi:hypothetical protein
VDDECPQGISILPHYKGHKDKALHSTPKKDVLLKKFWNYVDCHLLIMPGVNREKHRFEKRWLLDVLSTYLPIDEILFKFYLPPVKATRLRPNQDN